MTIQEISIDETRIIDGTLPKRWKCPHCGKWHRMDKEAEPIFLEFFKLLRHCGQCGYVHVWTLELTDGFKRNVVSMMMERL